MKYNNYLVRTAKTTELGFTLSRGHVFEMEGLQVKGLAIVRLALAPLEFTGPYSIIDINSGLFIIQANSKKKLIEKWKDKVDYSNIEDRILEARKTDKYIERVLELNEEKKNWRNSGYEVA